MNAFKKFSPWYCHPLAEWCRRTKVNSPDKKPQIFKTYTEGTLRVTEDLPAIRLESHTGEAWRLKEIRFNWAGRAVLWLFGFRRENK